MIGPRTNKRRNFALRIALYSVQAFVRSSECANWSSWLIDRCAMDQGWVRHGFAGEAAQLMQRGVRSHRLIN
jgi:hypothetical protein